MNVEEFEAAQTPWRRISYSNLLREFESRASRPLTIVGIDGRSGSGKTVLTHGLAELDRRVAVIRTDDIAWHHSFFDWADLFVENILRPLFNDGPPVSYRPPTWATRGRQGAIDVPSPCSLVLIEGVGACRREIQPFLDVAVWVHVPRDLGLQRVSARGVDSAEFLAEWDAAEQAFLAEHQPWALADIVVDGELGELSKAGRGGTVLVAAGPNAAS